MSQNLGRYANHRGDNMEMFNHGGECRKYAAIGAQGEADYN